MTNGAGSDGRKDSNAELHCNYFLPLTVTGDTLPSLISRHSPTNRALTFIKVFSDEQRPASLTGNHINIHMDPPNSAAQYDEHPRHRYPEEERWHKSPVPSPHPYPPAPPLAPYASANSSITFANGDIPNNDNRVPRDITRTPSPTPSEAKELKTGVLSWEVIGKWQFWFRREWLWYYVALGMILILTALMTIYHQQIVDWLTPVSRWLHDLKFGWLVPIGILFVISFPPLFGHEIVAVLCGLVWGLWIGFAIVAAGTFLGEIGNFYAFKYCCRARGEKLERSKITYACLAKVVRDGGFKIALIARLSLIPGHFTTAVFSTCGMGIVVFCIAAFLSLPKQFVTVYLGVILEQSETGGSDTKSRVISDAVVAVTFLITIAAMWYIFREMDKVKPAVIYARRKARQAKLARADLPYNRSDVFDVSTSDVNIPLTPRVHGQAERGDLYPFSQSYQHGSHNDAGSISVIYTPAPQAPNEYKPTNNYGYSKSAEYLDDNSSSGHSSHTHILSHNISRPSVDDVSWETGRYGPPGISTSPPNTPRQHQSSPQIPPQEERLPASPRLPSPYDVGGVSYHTPVRREMSEVSSVVPGGFSRVQSPPPPSYTTTAR
ncbi:uncharacterized protein BT62DRAFT_1081717 [Guyanagaster necrorhizus]|uniref:Golgi apparatus membrane protein TVP38 n=1 Tax=Guyanagaster necrorhizus TaxID=856835 RepID=A0A9P7VER5_9AGAR|nr:uncharacterized protein BT62DRAFT_1081717 [Guyanagaster necrorhizus MCA 3950]KAG7439227.1 hypothetical protein BT62DRAFT_1081717 [Guyanagaster necrorhizus MCA 3950]